VSTVVGSPAPVAGPGAPGRARRRARWIALAVGVVAAGLVVLLATRPSAGSTEAASPLLGKPAPAVAGTTVTGAPLSLSSYRGRWVLLDFFASWCPPCQQEQPELVTFAWRHRGPSGVAVVGVAYDDSSAQAAAFLRSTGATWPALADPGDRIAVDYGVRGPPEAFLVAPDGIVVAHLVGPVTDAQLEQLLARAQAAAP